MNLERKKIEDLITTAKFITSSQQSNKENLLFKINEDNEEDVNLWNSLLDDDVLQDPDKSYNLFYKGIQSFILNLIPKSDVRTIILELKSIMMTGKEKERISYGVRGRDSRMTTTKNMVSMIDTLTEWSSTPQDYYKLASLLLDKNKSLGYCPESRDLGEFLTKGSLDKNIREYILKRI